MANVKITDLPAFSGTPAINCLLEMVDTPSGTPTSKKLRLDDLFEAVGGLTQLVGPLLADKLLAVITSTGQSRYATVESILVALHQLATTGTFTLSDELGVYQVADSGMRRRTAQQLYDLANSLTAFTDPQVGDKLVAYDASASVTKSITFEAYLAILDLLTAFSGTIDGAADKLLYWDDDAGVIRSITPNKLAGGLHTIGIPAASLRPRQSNGPAALATTSGASGQPDVPYLAFDGAAAEYATFGPFWLPKSWGAGTLKARMAWRRASGTGAADVVWAMRGLTIGDNESPAQAFGTAATVTAAASTTTANFKFSGFTGDCTLAGSPAKGDLVFLEVYRDGAAGGDTLNSVDAWLSAVELLYTTDARDDA